MNRKLLMVLLCSPFFLSAQQIIGIDTSAKTFSRGTYPAYQVEIPQNKLATIEKDWVKYIKEGSKNKPESLNGEYVMHGAVNKNVTMSPTGFHIYSRLLETNNGVQLTAWFSENDTQFISRDFSADKNTAVHKYIRDFAVQEYRQAVQAELNNEKAALKVLEEKLASLIKDEEKSTKKISESNRTIAKNNASIKTNENDQENKAKQISTQKGIIDNIKKTPGAESSTAEKTLKTLESELKKLQKDKEKLHKEIDDEQEDIREEQRNIEKSKVEQGTQKGAIEKQKAKIAEVESKMAGIN